MSENNNNSMMIQLPEVKIDFDEESHIYTLNGYRLPSVTQLMRPLTLIAYDGVSLGAMSEAADRGTRAHSQVEAIVKYGIAEFDDDTEGYITAFQAFNEAFNPKWLASEYRCYHKVLRYAGTIDLVGYVQPDDGNGVDVADIKTTSAWHSTLLTTQLSAYAEMLKSHGVKVRNRYGLQLMKDGRYRFERLEDGYKTFIHCMAIMNAMAKENG